MISYDSKVTIGKPPEEVFPYLIEPAKQALWSDVPMRPLTGAGDMRVGTQMEVTFGMGPLKARVGLEITALEPNSRMAFESFSGPIGWKGEYRLSPADGGTELSQEGSLTFHGLWRLIQPLVGAEISRGEVKELERLKAVIEKA